MRAMDTENGIHIHSERTTLKHVISGTSRCAICKRRLMMRSFCLEEPADQLEPRLNWVLCGTCVHEISCRLARVSPRNPLRVRVAVAVVASERAPAQRPTLEERIDEKVLDHFFPVVLGIALFLHVILAIFIGIVH